MDEAYLVSNRYCLNSMKLEVNGKRFNIVAPVSNSDDIDFGLCRHSCLTDVLTTNRTIFEAASDLGYDSRYFCGVFGDNYSAQNLADLEFETSDNDMDFEELSYLVEFSGLASTEDYNKLESKVRYKRSNWGDWGNWKKKGNAISTGVRDTTGLRRFSCKGLVKFSGNNLHVDEEEIRNPTTEGSVPYFLRRQGAVAGVVRVYGDSHLMNNVMVYEPRMLPNDVATHGVMIVGCCLAQKESNAEILPCYRFQNNWGSKPYNIGIMPVRHFISAVAPIFEEKPADYLGRLRLGVQHSKQMVFLTEEK